MGNLNGLAFVNIELSSRCNKGDGTPGSGCWMCGRRKMEKEHPELCNWGDMPKEMVYAISKEVPKGIVVQFHNNGEPLLYSHLFFALLAFRQNIRSFNTNGKLLMERAEEIIGNLETLTISVIENDPERKDQIEKVTQFLGIKGDRPPSMVYRLLGKVDDKPWSRLSGIVARRVLHSPDGSFNYQKKPTIPEIGICLDLLTHLAIDRYGNVSLCVRFDPEGHLRLGNIKLKTLYSMWTGLKRKKYIEEHLKGNRSVLPGCSTCEYWGVPRGE